MLRRHARAWPGLAGDWLKDVHVLAVRVPVYRTAEFLKALKQVCGEPRPAAADAKWLFGSILQLMTGVAGGS
jgi:hypothetical protein